MMGLDREEFFRNGLIEEGCAFHAHMAQDYIQEARFYLTTISKFIDESEVRSVESIVEDAKNEPVLWEWHYPYYWDSVFRVQLYSSYLINLMAFAELQIKNICRDVAIIERITIDPTRFRNSILKNARKFLKIHLPETKNQNSDWETLYKLYDIRNIFVHSGGFIDQHSKAEAVKQFVNGHPNLSQNGFIRIEQGFSEFATDIVERIILDLYQKLNELCRSAEKGDPFI